MSNDIKKEDLKTIEDAAEEVKGLDVQKVDGLPKDLQPESLKSAAEVEDSNIIKIDKTQLATLVQGNNNFMNLVFASMDTLDNIQMEISNLNARVINMKENLKRVIRNEPPLDMGGKPIPQNTPQVSDQTATPKQKENKDSQKPETTT